MSLRLGARRTDVCRMRAGEKGIVGALITSGCSWKCQVDREIDEDRYYLLYLS